MLSANAAMTTLPHVVAVIAETDGGARIRAVAGRLPVWVADTPANRAAVEALRSEARGSGTGLGVTLFRVDAETRPDEWVAQVLGTVVEHHGALGHDPPLTALELYGVLVMGDLRATLSERGFDLVTSDGDAVLAQVAPAA